MSLHNAGMATDVDSSRIDLVLPLTDTRPIPGRELGQAVTPFSLIGYYNPSTDMVELFMANLTGTAYSRVTTLPN